jgi:arylsulfatase A-like enzyme
MAAYDSEIRYADDCIGQLFDYLRELDIADEVLLIFTSDHGEAFGEKGFFDHISCYENISHVPFIVKWPEKIPAGQMVEGYSLCTDMMPTILDFCGLPVPKAICGRSLVNTILKGEDTPHNEVVTNAAGVPIQRMYIKDGWALVHTMDKSIFEYLNTYELFNLSSDKAQEKNLAKLEKERFIEMRLSLDEWLDRELKAQPDLLREIVSKGGWWYFGIERAFYKNPDLFFKNDRVKQLILSNSGRAAARLVQGSQ